MNAIDDEPAPNGTRAARQGPPDPVGGTWDRADWQRIWLGTQSRPWRTLAVVAADRGVSTYEVASLITALGLQHGESIGLADVREVGLHRIAAIIDLAKEVIATGERLVFAARSIEENLATIPIARAADCVLLCVSLGSTSVALVKETVALLGKERFLGSLLVKKIGQSGAALSIPPRGARLEAGSCEPRLLTD
jgi:hypothetical protein